MVSARGPVARRELLPNGAVLCTLPLSHARHVALAVGVRVGSRHEPAELGGISHFLEHMLFRGTAEHPTSFAQNYAFESLGGTLDAATSAEATVFSATLPRDAAPDAIGLVAEMFRQPVMSNLELERNVVREEILDALDEDEQLVDADELAALALFGNHPLGRSIGGTVQSLAAISEPDLRRWHHEHYVGENVVIALTGAVTPAARRAAARVFGTLPRGRRSRAKPLEPVRAAKRSSLVRSTGSQVDLRVSFVIPGTIDPRWMAINALARVLDDGMSARVFRTMVEDRGLAYEAFGDLDPYRDVSALSLGAACRPESAAEATRALLELAEHAHRPLAPHELERVRTRARFELDLARDSPEAMVDMLVGAELAEEDDSLDELALRLRLLTEDDLVDTARAILRPEALSVIAVGPMTPEARRSIAHAAKGWRPT